MPKSIWQRHLPMLAALALLVTALLFFFEWLGSEQPQNWVESPIAVPDEKGRAAPMRP